MKNIANQQQTRRLGFTLIELLVVITIIVVLLSLLTPALDRAIYEAEMLVCQTNLRGIAVGVSMYAMGHKRQYPYRGAVREEGLVKPNIVRFGDHSEQDLIQGTTIDIDGMFNDPFCEKLDFTGSHPDSQLEADYFLWYGWEWRYNGSHRGMFKVGDKFSYSENGKTYKWSYMAGDLDFQTSFRDVHDSHPDKAGIMSQEVLQDGEHFIIGKATLSRWLSEGNGRGEVDHNYSLADNSVERIDNIKDDEWDDSIYDMPRMVKTPDSTEGVNYPDWWNTLPRK